MKKIKGYTIMEVTVTMLVAGILIGITYTMYSLIYKSYGAFDRKNQDMVVLASLDGVLARDFNRAEFVLKDTDGLSLRYNGHRIRYQFEPDYVTRTDTRTDTFKVKAEEVTTSFDGKPANQGFPAAEQNKVDELALSILYGKERIPFHYFKSYSSANLFQPDSHADN
ncbi:MAG: hypothetical protein JWP94_468 [Mucilaginibacter sp.]|nr:hypothetical protein [Mucilaginibacter sp.]